MIKLVFISNIPSPYQIKWAKELRKHYHLEFWFANTIEHSASKRPSYWNVELPEYCRILPSKLKRCELCYVPSMKKRLDEFDPDVVWLGGAWHMISWFQAYRWAVRNKKKIIVGPLEFARDSYRVGKAMKNKFVYSCLYKEIDSFICNGYFHYDIVGSIVPKKKRYIMMNAEDYEPYYSHPVRHPKSVLRFMYGGEISRRFRIPELLSVFEKLANEYENVELVLAGYGAEKDFCKSLIEESEILSKHVRWFDVTTWKDIPKAYESGDVFVINAIYSAGSFSTMYSLASGMGVISSIDVGSARSYIIDGYNGFLFNDYNGLYDSMKAYVENKDIVEIHGKRNKEISKKEFYNSKQKVFEKIISDLFKEGD